MQLSTRHVMLDVTRHAPCHEERARFVYISCNMGRSAGGPEVREHAIFRVLVKWTILRVICPLSERLDVGDIKQHLRMKIYG